MTYDETRCRAFIATLRELPERFAITDARVAQGLGVAVGPQFHVNPSPADSGIPADAILEAVSEAGLTRDDFAELDERPGRFDPDYRANHWHRFLRIVRNDPANDLFERLAP